MQQASSFSDPNVVNETYRRCAEGFPEAFGEYRPAHQRLVGQGIDRVGCFGVLEDGFNRLG